MKEVEVHLYTQSSPVVITEVRNAYTKGDMYCVMFGESQAVYKFPLQHIFRVLEQLNG